LKRQVRNGNVAQKYERGFRVRHTIRLDSWQQKYFIAEDNQHRIGKTAAQKIRRIQECIGESAVDIFISGILKPVPLKLLTK
jgi:hypothetical protein